MSFDLNTLPVPTWNHLGVNRAPDRAVIPDAPAGGWGATNTRYDALPDGCACRPMLPLACARGVSGLGAEADKYIRSSATFHRFYQADGTAKAPIRLYEHLDADHPNAITHTALHAQENACVTWVQVITADDGADGVSASLTQIAAERGARVRLIQVTLLPSACRRYNAVAVRCEAGARVDIVRAEPGAGVLVSGARFALEGDESACSLDAVYYGEGDDLLDFNDVAVHTGRGTTSNLTTAGVLSGSAEKILRGTIDFRRGAVRGVGHEQEDVILFSPDVRNRTAPLILCSEEEVEGQHAATIGRLDEDMLYYLSARGLSEADSRRMLVEARFAPILDKIPDAQLRTSVRDDIGRRLDHDA